MTKTFAVGFFDQIAQRVLFTKEAAGAKTANYLSGVVVAMIGLMIGLEAKKKDLKKALETKK